MGGGIPIQHSSVEIISSYFHISAPDKYNSRLFPGSVNNDDSHFNFHNENYTARNAAKKNIKGDVQG